MPEVITKYPEAVLEVLSGGGARCGGKQQKKILTKCPDARFCSTPTGETCVYGFGELGQMTQIKREDLYSLVCSDEKGASGGCVVASGGDGRVVSQILWLAALTLVILVLLTVRRARRDSPPR
jgi:MYXO-CTERM domain-containing protein